jgi:hypothetical protein
MVCKWEVLNNVHSGSLFKDPTGEDLSKYHVGAELHHEILQKLFMIEFRAKQNQIWEESSHE